MPFSDEGNALIKNLHQFKEYGLWRMLTEFVEIKWNKRAFNSLLKTIRETKTPTEGTGVADRSMGILKRT